jgi:hypothetical protein
MDYPSTPQGGGSKPPHRPSSLTDLLGLATVADDQQSPGLPGPTTVTSREPRVMAIIGGRPISLLLDTGATFSALPEFWGHTKPSLTSIVGVEGTPTQLLMTFPLTCILGDTLFTHSFLVFPNCPTPLLGRDILSKFQAILTLHPPPLKL